METYILWDYEFNRKRYVKWLLVTDTRSYRRAGTAFEKVVGRPPQAIVQQTPSQWLTGPLQIGL